MGKQKEFSADTVDSAGVVHGTVGENIRSGAKDFSYLENDEEALQKLADLVLTKLAKVSNSSYGVCIGSQINSSTVSFAEASQSGQLYIRVAGRNNRNCGVVRIANTGKTANYGYLEYVNDVGHAVPAPTETTAGCCCITNYTVSDDDLAEIAPRIGETGEETCLMPAVLRENSNLLYVGMPTIESDDDLYCKVLGLSKAEITITVGTESTTAAVKSGNIKIRDFYGDGYVCFKTTDTAKITPIARIPASTATATGEVVSNVSGYYGYYIFYIRTKPSVVLAPATTASTEYTFDVVIYF